jgi:hypothetical protein
MLSAAWDADLPPMEKLVLLALADCANDQGHCWPSASTLRKKSGQGERTVRRCIQSLIEKKHITQQQRSGTSPVYTVHPCQSGTPARAAPLPDRPDTPARAAPKPKGTVISSEAKASSHKRPRKKNPFPAPNDVPDQVWSDFLESPKRRKAGMSATAYAGITNNLRTLAEHGYPPGKMIALAVERGWTTVKLEWVQNDERQSSSNITSLRGHRPDPALDLLRAASAAEDRENRWGAGPSVPAIGSG